MAKYPKEDRAMLYRSLAVALFAAALARAVDDPVIADIHPSHGSGSVSSDVLPGDRLQFRRATVLDLITKAWGGHRETVLGGPDWLDEARYEVLVQLPSGANVADQRALLRRLLAERFSLAVHDDVRSVAVLALVPAGRGPQFRASAAGTPLLCGNNYESGPPVFIDFTCQHVTMAELAGRMRAVDPSVTKPVIDATHLEGAFDFTLRFTPLFDYQVAATAGASNPGVKFLDALEKAGLRLEPRQTKLPVVVIDRVNRPTPNAPDIAAKLPAAPTEFEVAEVKPSKPGADSSAAFRTGGVVEVFGYTIRDLMTFALDVNREHIVDAPKWFDSDRVDVIAKAAPGTPFEDLRPMLKALIADRLKLESHTAERDLPAYFLTAGKNSKLKPAADPSARSECVVSRGQSGSGPDAIPLKIYTCTNTTMEKFVKLIQPQAAGTLRNPVIDRTGLTGAYDFSLRWTRTDVAAAAALRKPSEGSVAAEPTGVITIFDAVSRDLGLKLEGGKQHPQSVLVIDHAEPIAPVR